MLRMMRKNAKSLVVKLVFGVIIVVFSFWGVGSMKAKQMTVAATVNGKIIERKTLDNSFRNLWRRYQEESQGKFNPDEARSLQIKREALNNLVDRQLMLEQADKLGLSIDESEIQGRIAGLGAFQKDGHFDQETYRRALSANRMTPAQFESNFKDDILIGKVGTVINDGVKILPDEIDILVRQQREEIALDLLPFNPIEYQAKMKYSQADLEKFFSEKQENFRIPEQRKIAALVIEREQLLSKAEVTDAQVTDFYEKNIERFKVKEQIKARHILIKIAPDASAEETEKARGEILEILKKVKSGSDFAELAKKFSQGPSNSMGGDLGWFGHGSMVKAFEDAAFALKPGEVSEPVRTRFGFHLIKIEEYKPARTKKLAEVKEGIEKGLRIGAYPDLLEKEVAAVTAALSPLNDSKEFVAAAQKLGTTVVETDLFNQRNRVVPDIGRDPALLALVFKTPLNQSAKIVNPSRNSYYFMVTEIKASYLPELAEVKSDVEKAYRLELARAEVKKISEGAAAQLKGGKTLDEVATGLDLKLVDSGFFSRIQAIPKIGKDPALSRKLFALHKGQISEALQHNATYFLARLRERKLELGADGDKLRQETEQQLLRYKQFQVMQEFVQALRQEADIEVMAGVLE
ncbi:MAG: SurA N-terminal domain-containing protein [Deltaproteobacteria bacterium]|nr:SurA N-terminal domain-containing protein [Candidatus Tharpella sp.]